MMGWWSFSLAALSARVVVSTTWRGVCIVPRTDSEGQDYFFPDGRGAGAAAEGTMWLRRIAGGRRTCRTVHAPTVLLTAPPTNPVHQLMDVLWSVEALGESVRLGRTHKVFVPMDASLNRTWLGWVLRRAYLGNRTTAQAAVELRGDDGCLCFAGGLVVPEIARFRSAPPAGFSGRLRAALVRDQRRDGSRPRALVYAHASTRRRAWLNAGTFVARARRFGAVVAQPHDLGRLPPWRQCALFHESDFILAAHGGHMANLVCAGPGTVVVEMACPSRGTGWLEQIPAFFTELTLTYSYFPAVRSSCPRHGEHDANFTIDVDALWGHLGRLADGRLGSFVVPPDKVRRRPRPWIATIWKRLTTP